MLIFNAHIHLNGSVSLKYLEETAKRNHCLENYQSLINEENLWKKFEWIHKIVQTPEDVTLAVIDVVEHSNADYLEIRTTPKGENAKEREEYVLAFTKGLIEAGNLHPNKTVRGLLSMDRTKHAFEDAKWIINTAVSEKQSSGVIVGIDLSGNYLKERKLTGNDLYQAIQYALDQNIGLALHVGETDAGEEPRDFDYILKAIQEYQKKAQKKLYGKVRLGHAIYRSEAQDEIIKALKIPVEICPSCHQILDWWKKDAKHPILTLYKKRSQVIPGTDNDLLFKCNASDEQKTLDNMLTGSEKYSHLTEEEQDKIVAEKRKRYMFGLA